MSQNERDYIAAVALQVYLKRMPTSPLTDESRAGYTSTLEQSFEIAELFVAKRAELETGGNERDFLSGD